jgi:hypothetical protein
MGSSTSWTETSWRDRRPVRQAPSSPSSARQIRAYAGPPASVRVTAATARAEAVPSVPFEQQGGRVRQLLDRVLTDRQQQVVRGGKVPVHGALADSRSTGDRLQRRVRRVREGLPGGPDDARVAPRRVTSHRTADGVRHRHLARGTGNDSRRSRGHDGGARRRRPPVRRAASASTRTPTIRAASPSRSATPSPPTSRRWRWKAGARPACCARWSTTRPMACT